LKTYPAIDLISHLVLCFTYGAAEIHIYFLPMLILDTYGVPRTLFSSRFTMVWLFFPSINTWFPVFKHSYLHVIMCYLQQLQTIENSLFNLFNFWRANMSSSSPEFNVVKFHIRTKMALYRYCYYDNENCTNEDT
jgi:hypothetical protein